MERRDIIGIYQPPASTLLYGSAGAGKTALAVSAMWDWRNKKKVANGKLITFGGEDNPALAVPEEMRQTEKGTSLRLTSPLLDSNAFVDQFDRISQRLVYDAQQGNALDVLVIDGLSEFDLLFGETYEDTSDNFAKWNALLSQMFSMMVRLSPSILGCQVIMTARVMERKKASTGGKKGTLGDPGFVDYDFYPSMRGSFRINLPHYFSLVLYMETSKGQTKDGKVVPVHVANMLRLGDYYIKNQFEHDWIAAGKPAQLVNPTWPALWKELTEALQYDGGYTEDEIESVS